MTDVKNLPYRLGVGMMLLNHNSQVFVGKRIDTRSEAWQMPQGGVDEGEDMLTAALRELEEEVGTNNVDVLAESSDWYYYDLPEEIVPDIWGGKYRGQKQKWFVFRLQGGDSDINIDTKDAEFCEWKWIDAEDLPDVIVPFKKDVYTAIVGEFKNIIIHS